MNIWGRKREISDREVGNVIDYRGIQQKKRKRGMHPLLYLLIVVAMISAMYYARNGVEDINISNDDLVYDVIYEGLKNGQTKITISTCSDTEQIFEQGRKVLRDHPEFFWVMGELSLSSVQNAAMPTYVLKVNSRCEQNNISTMMNALNATVDNIVSTTNANCSSDYEKAAFVHDLIVINCDYDTETYQNYLINSSDGTSLAYTAYGCLVNRKAVCEGYSKAYKLILNKLNIECEVVSGKANNGEGIGDHAWNYIKLDDGYYLIDVTWDDPVGGYGYKSNDIRRDYFCLNSEMMSKDHFADNAERVPYCDGKKYLGKR